MRIPELGKSNCRVGADRWSSLTIQTKEEWNKSPLSTAHHTFLFGIIPFVRILVCVHLREFISVVLMYALC